MTMNRKMGAPKEMATETMAMPMNDSAKAKKRMANMVASAAEVELYHFDPLAARDNSHPAIPCEDYAD